MQNIEKSRLSGAQRRFIEDLTRLLMTWSMPSNAARLYGYLQLMNEPVSLDDMARDLEISKSNACTAAKLLASHGNARRRAQRGTKRAFYVASDDPGAPLRKQAETLGLMSELILASKNEVSTGLARTRMANLAHFHKALQTAMQGVVLPEQQRRVA